MVPNPLVVLDSLPLTTNGKVDMAALRDRAGRIGSEAAAPRALPVTEMERLVAGIVADVLAIERADAVASFFDLGANSLRIVQIHRRVVERTGVQVPLVEMFRNPSIRALSAHLAANSATGGAGLEDESMRSIRSQALLRQERRAARTARAARRPGRDAGAPL
jgi:acyl carrier protein